MYSFTNPLVLLTLSVVLSGVQGRAVRHRSQVCYEDNELRALERFSIYADEFCPAFLAGKTSHLPHYVKHFNKKKVSSACSCYEKTATSLAPAATAALSTVLSSAPPAITAVFASPTSSIGGAVPSASMPSVGTGIPAYTAPLMTAPVVHPNSTAAAPNTVVSNTPAPAQSASTATIDSAPSFYTSEGPAPTDNGNKYPPQPPGAGPGKRGLCYDGKTQAGWSALFDGSQHATYGSNWDVLRGGQLDASLAYVPTIKVDASLNNNDWNDTVPVLIEGGTKALFGSNEPDNAGQANLKVADAVTVHKKYLQPYYGTVQLGTPAVTNGGGSTGLAYLEAFVEACTGCSFNFVNVHHYLQRSDMDVAKYAQALKDYIDKDVPAVQAKHPSIAGLPIFIGEWWLWDASETEGGDLMDILLPYLDNNPNVLGYQAFGGLWEGKFINSAGTGLTPAGQKYNTMSAAAPAATRS